MSNAINTVINKNSSNNKHIKYDLLLCLIDFQLDNSAIGIITVVNNTKYIDSPSTPRYKSK